MRFFFCSIPRAEFVIVWLMGNDSKKLGRLTLFLFVIKRLGAFLAMVFLTIVFYAGSIYVPVQFITIAHKVGPILVILDIALFLLGLSMAYLEYSHYGVVAGEEGITITRGFLAVEEISVPYRRIKEIKQDRSITDQMLGSSTLVMSVLGAEEGHAGESEIILPSLAKDFAESIQNKTLNQAEFEKIDVDEPKISTPGT